VFIAFLITACSSSKNSYDQRIQVAFHDVPYQTEKYLRIGYTLETWEYEKDGLELQQVKVLDEDTKEELLIIDKENLPVIHKDPIAPNPYFVVDTLKNYYLSIQLPIPLGKTPPRAVFHRFILKKTTDNSELSIEGAAFSPRTSETPLVIASPLKGKNLIFFNQSTMGYHFYVMIFINGKIYRSERYAIDTGELKDDLTTYLNGDPKVNTSYFNYGRPLYAVADGVVVHIQDGRTENSGDAKDVTFNSADELAGNYLVLDIGGGRYAYYCHCIPHSFLVKEGDTVKEGDQIAQLGNSGNSDAPHLHFHIADGSDLWTSNGIPFVLKEYTKTGIYNEPGPGTLLPQERFTNAMMENTSVFKVEFPVSSEGWYQRGIYDGMEWYRMYTVSGRSGAALVAEIITKTYHDIKEYQGNDAAYTYREGVNIGSNQIFPWNS
jgi:hypothetical protein